MTRFKYYLSKHKITDNCKITCLVIIIITLLVSLLISKLTVKRLKANAVTITEIVNVINIDDVTITNQTVDNINNHLQGVLTNKANVFVAYATLYNVDPFLLVAISLHETGWGTSDLAVDKNNIYGGMRGNTAITYASVDDSISDLALTIANYRDNHNLNTISEIQTRFAPLGADNDPNNLNYWWTQSITDIYARLIGGAASDVN